MPISRSRALSTGNTTIQGFVTVYTCPVGFFALVKTVTVCNLSNTTLGKAQIWLAQTAGSSVMLEEIQLEIGLPGSLATWHVLEAEDEIAIFNAAPNLSWWISGAEIQDT